MNYVKNKIQEKIISYLAATSIFLFLIGNYYFWPIHAANRIEKITKKEIKKVLTYNPTNNEQEMTLHLQMRCK